MPSVTEPEPDDGSPAEESADEKRARVMARLAEMLKAGPPELSGSGPVSAGGFPVLPSSADEFDQEKASELLAALSQIFEARTRPGADEPSDEPEEE